MTDAETIELMTAIGTGLAAFAAMGSVAIAIYALISQRRHDEASAMPILKLDQVDNENRLAVILANRGVGPAIISSVKVKKAENGKFGSSIYEFMPSLPDTNWVVYASNFSDEVIAQQHSITILDFVADSEKMKKLHTPEELAGLLKTIRLALGDLTVEIQYTDVYESKSWSLSKPLTWFHRRFPKTVAAEAAS